MCKVNTVRTALEAYVAANPKDRAGISALADYLLETGECHDTITAVEYAEAVALVYGTRKASAKARTAIRAATGNGHDTHVAVLVVPGDKAPELDGRGWHYTTKAGTYVRYPNAYKRVAKSADLVYHASTYRVTVGASWVAANI